MRLIANAIVLFTGWVMLMIACSTPVITAIAYSTYPYLQTEFCKVLLGFTTFLFVIVFFVGGLAVLSSKRH